MTEGRVTEKRTFVVGDVHGCYHTLLDLVRSCSGKEEYNSDFIFLGDLNDKGPFSRQVIEFVKSNHYRCLLGNHEFLFFNNNGNPESPWVTRDLFGGKATMDSYEGYPEMLQDHLEWISGLPYYLEIDDYFLTHGFGIPYWKRRKDPKYERALMSNRPQRMEYKKNWEKGFDQYDVFNIFGHEAADELQRGPNYIGIDTGCVYNGKLTAFCLETREVVSVVQNPRDEKR